MGLSIFIVNKNKDYEVPAGYIAVFHGGQGEVTYSTYIYKIDNGKSNYGFKYISTQNTTTSYGSSTYRVKLIDKGTVEWTDDVFKIAEKNNSYSYVIIPDVASGKQYTIEEFRESFLKN